ncbi:MAG TPA: TolC family protein [Chitinophagales bacterium]|nr:TolC family protein [Chitinophagales bacterium]
MRIFILLLMVGIWSVGYSQDTIQISMEDLKQKSLEGNLAIKSAKNETKLAEAEMLASRAMYLPNILASYTFMNTNSPLNAFAFKLNQERIAMTDFNPDLLNNPKVISDFATKFEIQQPIFNLDAIYMKKAGNVKSEVLKIKEQRTKEYIQLELNKAYMMLQLTYKIQSTLIEAKNTALANKKVIDNYYANGMIQKPDVLYMDLRINEIDNQIQFVNSNILNASDYLFLLLNEDANDKVFKPTEELEYNSLELDADLRLNRYRKDIQAYEKSLEAFDYLVKSTRAKYLPRLNAFGSFEFHDHKFARFRANNYLVGAQLQWQIFDGLKAKSEQVAYKANQIKIKSEIEQYTQQSELELKKISRQIEDAEYKVKFAVSALEQSKEAYRIRKDRYEQGLEKSSDLLNAEIMMSQKHLEYYQAVFEYNTALAYYNFLK